MLLAGIFPSKTRYSSNFPELSSFLQVSDTKAAAAETQERAGWAQISQQDKNC